MDATATEEAAGEDEGADGVQRDTDGIDWNVDEAGVPGALGGHDDAECDQRQTCKLHNVHTTLVNTSAPG